MSNFNAKRRFRPGIVQGRYPQKAESNLSALAHWLEVQFKRIQQLTRHFQFRLSYVAGRVNRQAQGLATLDEAGLTEVIEQLRLQLSFEGLTPPLIFRAFAIIREVAARTLNKSHYDCQLLGGWIMINGMVAQMATGEGKTLTTTLPACTAALAGIPVHVITANDYLAERDATLLEALYKRLGISVGVVIEGMATDQRRHSYLCDIVHTTHKQIAFDYLRDRIVMADDCEPLRMQFQRIQAEQEGFRNLLLRGLCFAIVDEADSVLIDDAATPLILSRSITNEEDEAAYLDGLYVAASMLLERDFTVNFDQRHVHLTAEGKIRLEQFAKILPKSWRSKPRREALILQALSAQHLYLRDNHYLVRESKVYIIDQATGRIMPDRAWEQGLQQMIEAKEGCLITPQREPLARISYQRFFSRYCFLAGTSGTVKAVAAELLTVYGLPVVAVPTHRPVKRQYFPEQLYLDTENQWQALVARVEALHPIGQPILIGTATLVDSNRISMLLTKRHLPHRVLNAQQDRFEADIIAQAGQLGSITVATNMAGRGTDIELSEPVKALGGLYVIATSRNIARRIDLQLFGRCARQGDPGSVEAILSLQDERIEPMLAPVILKALRRIANRAQQVPFPVAMLLLTLIQKQHERQQWRARMQLLLQDKLMAKILAFSGRFD